MTGKSGIGKHFRISKFCQS